VEFHLQDMLCASYKEERVSKFTKIELDADGRHSRARSRLEPFQSTYRSRGGTGGFSMLHGTRQWEDEANVAQRNSTLGWPRW
jgi:hypothetical protein